MVRQTLEEVPRKRGRGRPKLPKNELSGNTVQTLERGLLLLQALSKGYHLYHSLKHLRLTRS